MNEIQPSLTLFLNKAVNMKNSIVHELFLVEELRALYYHLNSSEFFSYENGQYHLNENVATYNFSHLSLSSLLRLPFQAASNLYSLKKYITRPSESSLISVIQESLEVNVVTPFYHALENAPSSSLIEFIISLRKDFLFLNNIIPIITAKNPVKTIFAFAERNKNLFHGQNTMLKIATSILYLWKDLCQSAINEVNSSAISVPDFFIQRSGTEVIVQNLPHIIPNEFANDIAEAALCLLIKAPPLKFESVNGSINLTSQDQIISNRGTDQFNIFSFDLILPTTIPISSSVETPISNFRAAAWNISNYQTKETEKEVIFSSLKEAVSSILLDPLWNQAKEAEKDIIQFLFEDQKLIDVFNNLFDLFLMRRGDLHNSYISHQIPYAQSKYIFDTALIKVPYFQYRFACLPNETIIVSIPHRLRRFISNDNISQYESFYQFLKKLQSVYYNILVMKPKPTIAKLRCNLIRFFQQFINEIASHIEGACTQMISKIKETKSLRDIINVHNKLMNLLKQISFEPFDQMNQLIQQIIGIGLDLINPDLTEDEIYQIEIHFSNLQTFFDSLIQSEKAQAYQRTLFPDEYF